MGVTVLPSSLSSRRVGAAASSRACASRLRLDPASVVTSAAKQRNRPGSSGAANPPSKRRRSGEDAGAAVAQAMMSLDEKNGANRMLLPLLPSGRSAHEVIPLPDSVVRVLQENGTRCGGGDDEIEIDVQALGDDALRVIKDRVGAYLEVRAQREEEEEAPLQSKEGVIRQSKPRSTTSSKAASKSIASSKATSKSIPPRAAAPLHPAAPTPSESVESVGDHVETPIIQSPPRSTPPSRSGSTKSMSELLAEAAEVMKKVVRRREIEKLRAAARREVEQMVRTVEFNDPYIDVQDVFK